MPIEIFVFSGLLAGILTSLAQSWTRVIRQEYRNREERRWIRQGFEERISAHFGVPYEDFVPGRHRLEGCAAAHHVCPADAPCVHRGRRNGMVRAAFYIERARREEQAKREAAARYQAQSLVPWPRAEDVYEYEAMPGLLCGYRTPSNFPGLSTPPGSSTDLTAESTSTPRSPISVGR